MNAFEKELLGAMEEALKSSNCEHDLEYLQEGFERCKKCESVIKLAEYDLTD